MNEFKLNRSLLSGYYVAIMISYFLFKLLKEQIVSVWTIWFLSFLKSVFKINATTNGYTWLSLIFICFIVTFIIRRFVVEVLDLHSSNKEGSDWENTVLAFLIFGFFIYTTNQIFSQPMPREWFPEIIIKLFGGDQNTLGGLATASIEERNTWSIVPWIWTIGPLAFMFTRTLAAKFKSGEK